MADKLAELRIEITTELDKIKSELNSIKSKSIDTTDKISGAFKKLGGIIAGAFAATKIIGFFKESINAYREEEDAIKKLDTALGKHSKTLIDQSSALQKLTTYGDEQIIQAQARFAAFTKDEDQIKALTKATLDFAEAKEVDLVTAADLVAKTFGSTTNALSRYGIEVEGTVGSNERLQDTVDGITKLFGGQAEAAAKTYSGRITQLGNIIGDLKEKVGLFLLNALEPMINSFESLLKTESLSEMFDRQVQKVKELETNIVPLLSTYDELKGRTNLNKTEQEKLKTIIIQIGEAIPTAITQFGKYGEALDINKGKVLEFIEAEKARLQHINEDLIITEQENLKSLKKEKALIEGDLNRALKQGKVRFEDPYTGKIIELKATGNDIKKFQNQIKELQLDIDGTVAQIKFLKGEIDKPTEGGDITKAKGEVAEILAKIKELQDANEDTGISLAKYQSNLKEINKLQDKLTDQTDEQGKKQKELYDILGFMSSNYYDIRKKQIEDEAKEFLKAGENKIDVEKWVQKQIAELNKQQKEAAGTPGLGEKLGEQAWEQSRPTIGRSARDLANERRDAETEAEEFLKQIRIQNITDEFEQRKAQINLEAEEILKKYSETEAAKLGLDEEFAAVRHEAELNREKQLAEARKNANTEQLNTMNQVISAASALGNRLDLAPHTFLSQLFKALDTLSTMMSILNTVSAGKTALGIFSSVLSFIPGGGAVASIASAAIPHATGGSFIIPSGFPDDSYPLGLNHYGTTGEMITVTPRSQIGSSNGGIESLLITLIDAVHAQTQTTENLELKVINNIDGKSLASNTQSNLNTFSRAGKKLEDF